MKKILSAILLFSLLSCNKISQWDCTKSTGKITTKIISPEPYKVIELHSMFNVTLIQDSQNYIMIKGGENLLPKIELEYSYPYLKIYDNNICRWVRNYQKEQIFLDIHFSQLDSIIAYRENNIKSKGYIKNKVFMIKYPSSGIATLDLKIDVDTFYLKINPYGGDFYVEGSCKFNYIYSVGYSYVHAENVTCLDADVTSYSTGDIYVNPSRSLSAHIFNFGNIYYCSPINQITVEKPEHAKGKVIYKQCSNI